MEELQQLRVPICTPRRVSTKASILGRDRNVRMSATPVNGMLSVVLSQPGNVNEAERMFGTRSQELNSIRAQSQLDMLDAGVKELRPMVPI